MPPTNFNMVMSSNRQCLEMVKIMPNFMVGVSKFQFFSGPSPPNPRQSRMARKRSAPNMQCYLNSTAPSTRHVHFACPIFGVSARTSVLMWRHSSRCASTTNKVLAETPKIGHAKWTCRVGRHTDFSDCVHQQLHWKCSQFEFILNLCVRFWLFQNFDLQVSTLPIPTPHRQDCQWDSESLWVSGCISDDSLLSSCWKNCSRPNDSVWHCIQHCIQNIDIYQTESGYINSSPDSPESPLTEQRVPVTASRGFSEWSHWIPRF
jgi:hypothetical protein